MIETERLIIFPSFREQMESCIVSEQDQEMKKALQQIMLGTVTSSEAQAL